MKTSNSSMAAIGLALMLASLLGFAPSAQEPGGNGPTIQGVWRMVERTTTGSAGSTNKSPQGGVWIFTRQYNSQVGIALQTDKPRPDLPDPAKATADELRAAWGPVVATSGPYHIAGNVLTFNNIVNKNPVGMKTGASVTWTYKLEGNALEVTQKTNESGPITNPVTLKFTRLE
jgi:hypothetical protein